MYERASLFLGEFISYSDASREEQKVDLFSSIPAHMKDTGEGALEEKKGTAERKRRKERKAPFLVQLVLRISVRYILQSK